MEITLKTFISNIELDLQRKLTELELQLVKMSYFNGYMDSALRSLTYNKEVL